MSPSLGPGGSGRTARRELLINVALSLAVTLVLITGLEGTARLFKRPEVQPQTAVPWAQGAEKYFYYYTFPPNPPGWPPHEVNAEGFRDRDHTIGLPEDAWRVVILGDSVTDGNKSPAHEAPSPQRVRRPFVARRSLEPPRNRDGPGSLAAIWPQARIAPQAPRRSRTRRAPSPTERGRPADTARGRNCPSSRPAASAPGLLLSRHFRRLAMSLGRSWGRTTSTRSSWRCVHSEITLGWSRPSNG
jgi:hypothetical protein